MKELFDRLIHALPGVGRRDDPDRLRREVVRLHEGGRHQQARDAARRLVEVQRERLGERHPEFASALSDLALLLQTQGDLGAAEPLLRQAVEVRKEALGELDPRCADGLDRLGVLLQLRGNLSAAEPLMRQALAIRKQAVGEHHADYAASLSHLGSLLFERHDHAAAEPLLRQAVAIRKGALGAAHPDVVADLQTLEAILQARTRPTIVVRGARGQAAAVVPIPSAASDSALEQLGRGPREIAAEARGLAETFARVGAALAHAARGMQHGLPPQIALLNDSAACHNAFAAIQDEALGRAGVLDLAPPNGTVLSLTELAKLMDRVGRVEEELDLRAAARLQAQAVLDRVLSLRHRVPSEAPLLRPCHEAASSLRRVLAEARLSEGVPEDGMRLAAGTHPLAALVRLVEPDPPLSDDDWSRLHLEVSGAFGRPLAAAAVRGRLESAPSLARVATLNGKIPDGGDVPHPVEPTVAISS